MSEKVLAAIDRKMAAFYAKMAYDDLCKLYPCLSTLPDDDSIPIRLALSEAVARISETRWILNGRKPL